jgi:predicted HAD superfamily hydrolase
MNSWDCFDTLVARRFVEPYTIFEEVGRRLGIEKFSKLRRWAEKNSDRTYEGIYKNLPNIDSNIEFQVELEHCFGIVENINKVQDGDIIVSDMYLTKDQIRQILISCGLKKDVEIYVTPDGKHRGTIWSSLPKIDLHVGDNLRSDVESPRSYGITAEHYTGHQFNETEKFVSDFDFELACWMRYVRLQCPYSRGDKLFWLDQSNLNLPVLA